MIERRHSMKKLCCILIVVITMATSLGAKAVKTAEVIANYDTKYKSWTEYKVNGFQCGGTSVIPGRKGNKSIKVKQIKKVFASFTYSWMFEEIELQHLSATNGSKTGDVKYGEVAEIKWTFKPVSEGKVFLNDIIIIADSGCYVFHVGEELDYSN